MRSSTLEERFSLYTHAHENIPPIFWWLHETSGSGNDTENAEDFFLVLKNKLIKKREREFK